MIAVVCVDDRNGIRFGGRRQSRDRILCEDMIRTCGTVWMHSRSAPLFSDWQDRIRVDDAFLLHAEPGAYCFVEEPLENAVPEGMILYRWNRRYPADVYLDVTPESQGMELVTREDFTGSSHERITKEIWRLHHGER